jgi:hypothetical protein
MSLEMYARDYWNEALDRPFSWITPAALFWAFSPGNLFIMPGATSWMPESSMLPQNHKVLVTHAVLFSAVYLALKKFSPSYT